MKLILKDKLLSLHDKITVKDEEDQILYRIESKMLSIADKTYVYDQEDYEVAYIHRKPISIHNKYYVEMNDGVNFEISSELLHAVKDVFNIDELGWQIQGNIMEHDYQIIDDNGNVIASTHRKWASLHDVFVIDVENDEDAAKVVCIYVVLEHILDTREAIRKESIQ